MQCFNQVSILCASRDDRLRPQWAIFLELTVKCINSAL